MTFEEAVTYLNDVPRFTKKHALDHTKRLLGYLGHPEKSFEVIHVAGSNGKGSVCSYLDSALRMAGVNTGRFISPHLVTICERFVVNGEMITEVEFLAIFDQIMEMLRNHPDEEHPTYFEFLFLMGMLYFDQKKIDIAVLETGLGGRLDATNAVDHPALTIITSIALEHQEYLGNTLAEIAAEKAGIIKEGVPVVYDASEHDVDAVIRSRAQQLNAKAYPIHKEQAINPVFRQNGIDFSFDAPYDKLQIHLPTSGEYQIGNAMLAATALSLYFHQNAPKEDVIEMGLAKAKWPGRMEAVEEDVFFDGAHNPAGIEALLASVSNLCGEEKAILLFSALEDKNYEEMVQMLTASVLWDKIIVTQLTSYRAADATRLLSLAGDKAVLVSDVAEAYAYAKAIRKPKQKLFCCGSLYLIGELESCL